MKRSSWLMWLIWVPLTAASEQVLIPPAAGEPSHCPDCHQQEYESFRRSRMAVAARTPDFLREWEDKGRVDRCMACHAPSGGEGVECVDCHDDTGHPYSNLEIPGVCARCHDAPGELTVRSYRQSPAAKRGEGCLDCHLDNKRGSSHDFEGPTRPGFLQGIAQLRLSLRRDDGGDTLLIGIRHQAGHALPGGTTGRSVWLVVDTLTDEDQLLTRSRYRFGWLHDPDQGWIDRTLQPGPGEVVEIPLQNGIETARVEARLIYRFQPGPLEAHDPREVVLDRTRFALSVGMGESQ